MTGQRKTMKAGTIEISSSQQTNNQVRGQKSEVQKNLKPETSNQIIQ